MRRWSGIFVAALTGCTLFTSSDTVCTEIGCIDGLNVQFRTPQAGLLRIELHAHSADDQPAYVYDCAQSSNACANGAFFPGYTASGVVVSVVSAAGTRSRAFAVTYEVTHPNGRDCPPECRNASVIVDFPSGSPAI